MKKQKYQKPTMNVVKIQHSQMLCASITGVESGGTGITVGGPGSGPARARSFGWDDPKDKLNLSDKGGSSSIWDR